MIHHCHKYAVLVRYKALFEDSRADTVVEPHYYPQHVKCRMREARMGFGDCSRKYSPVVRPVPASISLASILLAHFGRRLAAVAGIGLTLGLAACVPNKMGPTVQVMPGAGKSFADFQADQAACETYADGQVAGARKQANQQAVGTALLGSALGAGLGAAAGNAGAGAAAGAAVGTGVAATNAQDATLTIQQQY